jgi:membrane-associated PAP2 superfamily phosphatase
MENSKILAIRKINILIIITSILIALALCLINYSNIDFVIQNHLFDFKNKTWLIDHNEPIKKFFFYKLPKIFLGFGIFFCLIATVFGFKKKSQFFYKNRHKFFLIFLGLSLIPLIVGNIKK